MIKFRVPFPPSVNHYYIRRGPMTFVSERGLKFKKDILEILKRTKDEDGIPVLDFQYQDPIKVDIVATFPDYRRRDLDNLLKCTLDSLCEPKNQGLILNDSLIWSLKISRNKEISKNNGFLDITVDFL